jgi:glycosyltransferase involved in cell wall biosynthesis
MEFVEPHIIHNTPDPTIFHSTGRVAFDRERKVRLISVSWSDNPNKGAATYRWLEEHLDWERFDYTFVGRSSLPFERLRTVTALPSAQLAEVLRQHDILITASLHESCSNTVLEALACGLPVLYIQSGSHAELVGEAGSGFAAAEELPALLDRLVNEYEQRQAQIRLLSLAEVADRYLEVLGLSA